MVLEEVDGGRVDRIKSNRALLALLVAILFSPLVLLEISGEYCIGWLLLRNVVWS